MTVILQNVAAPEGPTEIAAAQAFSNAKNTGEAKGDIFFSIERLRGGNFDDFLQGDAANNMLEGGAGADVIRRPGPRRKS